MVPSLVSAVDGALVASLVSAADGALVASLVPAADGALVASVVVEVGVPSATAAPLLSAYAVSAMLGSAPVDVDVAVVSALEDAASSCLEAGAITAV